MYRKAKVAYVQWLRPYLRSQLALYVDERKHWVTIVGIILDMWLFLFQPRMLGKILHNDTAKAIYFFISLQKVRVDQPRVSVSPSCRQGQTGLNTSKDRPLPCGRQRRFLSCLIMWYCQSFPFYRTFHNSRIYRVAKWALLRLSTFRTNNCLPD